MIRTSFPRIVSSHHVFVPHWSPRVIAMPEVFFDFTFFSLAHFDESPQKGFSKRERSSESGKGETVLPLRINSPHNRMSLIYFSAVKTLSLFNRLSLSLVPSHSIPNDFELRKTRMETLFTCIMVAFGASEPSDIYTDNATMDETTYFASEYDLETVRRNDNEWLLRTPLTETSTDMDLFTVHCTRES